MKSRRKFIKQSVAVSAGFMGFSQYLGQLATARPVSLQKANDWLELPKGFSTKIISMWGDKMSDGLLVPGRPDGMATFAIGEKTVIIRNHENSSLPSGLGAFGKNNNLLNRLNKASLYDFGHGRFPSLGGTTTLIYNENTQQVEKQFLSLAGTNRNCAGGPTPWNTWLTCEEDVTTPGGKSEQYHGYIFEVPASGQGLTKPVPLKAMGRFNHEAVAVAPETGIVYLTEDRHDSLIYRFLPNEPEKLEKGGTLQALVVKEQFAFDTRNYHEQLLKPGASLEVEWITLKHVDTPEDDLRLRGRGLGAAIFARGEGMWFGNNEIYFACTNGGKSRTGQVFKYKPGAYEGTNREKDAPGKLTLFAEPNDTAILKYCDNLTVAPWGDVILVEDSSDACIRGITPEGKIYTIGRNIGSDSELAGVCFSPSGKTLFLNIQEAGLTLAITGPWENLKRSY